MLNMRKPDVVREAEAARNEFIREMFAGFFRSLHLRRAPRRVESHS